MRLSQNMRKSRYDLLILSRREGDVGKNNDSNISTLVMSSTHDTSITTDSEIPNPSDILKKIKLSNVNRLVIGHININSLRNKFEPLKIL